MLSKIFNGILFLGYLMPIYGSIRIGYFYPLIIGETIILASFFFNIRHVYRKNGYALIYLMVFAIWSLLIYVNANTEYISERVLGHLILLFNFIAAKKFFEENLGLTSLFSKLILIFSIINSYLIFVFPDYFNFAEIYYHNDIMFGGGFGNSNNNALVIFSCYILYRITNQEKIGIFLFLTLISIILTGSRYFIIALIFFELLNFSVKRLYIYIFIAAVSFFFIQIFFQKSENIFIQNKLSSFSFGTSDYLGDRVEIWSNFFTFGWLPLGYFSNPNYYHRGELHSYLLEIISIYSFVALPIFAYLVMQQYFAIKNKLNTHVLLYLLLFLGTFVTSTISHLFIFSVIIGAVVAHSRTFICKKKLVT